MKPPISRPAIATPHRAVLRAALVALAVMAADASRQLSAQQDHEIASIAQRAAEARDRGDTVAAISLYGQAAAQDRALPEPWWFLGVLHYQRDEYAAARDAFSQFLTLVPQAGPASALRGLCEFELSQYSEALADIRAGLAAGAGNSARSVQILSFHEAQILTLTGHFEAALTNYTVAAQAGPLSESMQVGLGLAGLRIPRLSRDVPDSQRPMLAAAGGAAALLLIGRVDAGRSAYRAFLTQYPEVPNSHYLLGYLLFTGDPAQAMDEFRKELAVSPHSEPANSMLAWAFLAQNDAKNALLYAREAVAAAPASPFAQLVAGRALVDSGDYEAGLHHLTASLQLDPGNLDTHIALAKAYSELGQKERAREERIRSIELAAQQTSPESQTTADGAAKTSRAQP